WEEERMQKVKEKKLKVEGKQETNEKEEHRAGATKVKEKLGGKTGRGENITGVQDVFGKAYKDGTEFARDGSQFDKLFEEGDTFNIGNLEGRVLHTPGHTPACLTYVIGDAGFVGDTLFMPDFGTARCDFPGGDARALFQSIQKVLALPPETRLFMCHDYGTPDRDEFLHMTTVAEEREANVHVHEGVSEDEFVKMRTERDATLDMPRLILPSVQVNMRAGEMPPAEDNDQVYLKVPINLF
ncbi:MAG: MBL fold metallo-hydrolase, partial [Alteromonadaceae bacterium]|nr:MBL fold metallo-hydrolase [Alteromonadaceae bacterium]